jgi:hypothetical protein
VYVLPSTYVLPSAYQVCNTINNSTCIIFPRIFKFCMRKKYSVRSNLLKVLNIKCSIHKGQHAGLVEICVKMAEGGGAAGGGGYLMHQMLGGKYYLACRPLTPHFLK